MRVVAGLLLGLALGAAACQKKPPAEVPVKGRVKGANGQPLAGAVVRFHAAPGRAGARRTVSCVTAADGTFEARALPGTYKVTLLAVPKGAATDPDPKATGPPPGVPALYASPAQTRWEVEVPAGGKDDVALEVKK
jgi:hypothetical protein